MKTLILLPVIAILGCILISTSCLSYLLAITSDGLDWITERLVELGDYLTDDG